MSIWQWLAWRLPRSLVFWCFVRVMAHATTGKRGNTHPDDVNYSMAARRWLEDRE